MLWWTSSSTSARASLLTSTLLRHVNSGDFTDAAPQFLLWDHCKGVVIPGPVAQAPGRDAAVPEGTLFAAFAGGGS